MVKKYEPKCLFLMETKSDRRKMEKVYRRLNFQNWFIVEARGLAGGLALLWTDDIDIECLWH